MRSSKLLLAVLLAGSIAQARARPASAAEDPRDVARGYYARGLDLAGQGAYEAALAEFKEAYRISPHFAVLYNIGQAEVALGRPLGAIESLSKYLRDGQEQVPHARRQQVEAQIALLESLFAELTITTDRTGTLISVDGREVGRTPLYQPIRLTAGTHKISAVFGGGPRVNRSITIGQGDRQALSLEMPASAAEERTIPGAQSPSAQGRGGPVVPSPLAGDMQPDSGGRGRRRAQIIAHAAAGVGAALGGAALGVYLWNRGRYQDWQTANAALQRDKTSADYHDGQIANNRLADSLTTANRVIAGLSVASGALLATGVTLLVVDRVRRGGKEESAAGRSVADINIGWGWLGPGSAVVTWTSGW
jgi:tetratricopeptide (TPR) repeat protein